MSAILQKQPRTFRKHTTRPGTAPGLRKTQPRVSVHDGPTKAPPVVEVDSPRHVDLLAEIYRVLFDLRVQVIRVRAQPTETRVVQQLEIVEFDGAPVSQRRRVEIESVLATTLERRVAARQRQGQG